MSIGNPAVGPQVFCFFVNRESGSWAYATPNFQRALKQPHLDTLRQAAGGAGWERVRVMPQPGREEVELDDEGDAAQVGLRIRGSSILGVSVQ